MATICAAVFQMATSVVAFTISLSEICIFYKKNYSSQFIMIKLNFVKFHLMG